MFESMILDFAFSYFAGKFVDIAIDKGKSFLPKQSYEADFFDCLDKATRQMCKHFALDIPTNAPETVCQNLPASSSNGDIEVCLSKALEGQEIQKEHIEYWRKTVNAAIASAKNGELYRYLKLECQHGDKTDGPKDKVWEVIEQYAENFTKPLFLHVKKNDKVNLTNLYVPPRVKYRHEEYRGFEPVLTSFLQDEDSDILFVEGDAAVGKTSLVSQLCYQYRYGDRSIFQGRPLVCVRLRDLDVSDKGKKNVEYFLSYLDVESRKAFSHRYGNAVVVLDGADELVMIEGKQLHMDAEKFFRGLQFGFQNCKWIITGRPQYVEKGEIERKVEATILHFDTDMRQEWAEYYCQQCEEKLSPETEQFIRTMTDEDASGVADTPLALYLLAQSKVGKSYKDNPWLLYHEIFSSAIHETEYNINLEENVEDIQNWTGRYSKGIYHFIGQIAFRMFQNKNDEFISDAQLKELVNQEETSPDIVALAEENEEKDWVKTLCAICGYWKDNGRGALEFYHNNIRDFFFCEYIYDRVLECLQWDEETGEIRKEEAINKDKFIETVAELFPHRPLASKWREKSTTWEQTFMFLYHRLSYEYTQKEEKSLCKIAITEEYNPLPDVLYAMVGGNTLLPALGAKKSNTPPLKQIENIYLNTLFLSRIWQEVFRINGIIGRIQIWNGETQRELWDEIFISFSHLLSYRVSVETNSVSIGSLANLYGAHLSWAHLNRANLYGADLDGADLYGADLDRAHLSWAHLSWAHLNGAHLNGTDLNGADLSWAHLEQSIWLEKAENLEYAHNLDEAYLPSNCYVKKRTDDFFGPGPYYEITWDDFPRPHYKITWDDWDDNPYED